VIYELEQYGQYYLVLIFRTAMIVFNEKKRSQDLIRLGQKY
jgi:hypothetical protein